MRICVVDTFRDHHPVSGGHAIRVSNIATWLSEQGHSVLLIRPAERSTLIEEKMLKILSVGADAKFVRLIRALQAQLLPRMRHFQDSIWMNAPSTLRMLRTYIQSADLVQLEDPTLLGPLLMAKSYRKIIIADSDGISSQVARQAFNVSSPGVRSLFAYALVLFCERLWCRLSSRIVTSSIGDRQALSSLHHLKLNKIAVVPNPFDIGIKTAGTIDEGSIRRSLGLSSKTPTAIFVGDLRVQHNAEAVDYIARMITDIRGFHDHKVRVIVVGKFDLMPPRWKLPDLIFTGPVRDLAAYIGASNVCIAPLFSQPTGIKTKVLTYLALGKTTVATPPALIGLDASVREHVTECSVVDFPAVLLDKLTKDFNPAPNRTVSAIVESLYGVDAVGRTYAREVLEHIHDRVEISSKPVSLDKSMS